MLSWLLKLRSFRWTSGFIFTCRFCPTSLTLKVHYEGVYNVQNEEEERVQQEKPATLLFEDTRDVCEAILLNGENEERRNVQLTNYFTYPPPNNDTNTSNGTNSNANFTTSANTSWKKRGKMSRLVLHCEFPWQHPSIFQTRLLLRVTMHMSTVCIAKTSCFPESLSLHISITINILLKYHNKWSFVARFGNKDRTSNIFHLHTKYFCRLSFHTSPPTTLIYEI